MALVALYPGLYWPWWPYNLDISALERPYKASNDFGQCSMQFELTLPHSELTLPRPTHG